MAPNEDYDVEVAGVRPGQELNWDRLEEYLRAAVPGLGPGFSVAQFPHGSANLTYLITFGTRRVVVRRPPFGELAPGAHDMRREYRAQRGLSSVYPRAPRPLAYCDDPAVIGAEFVVVEYRHGIVVWDHVPTSLDVGTRAGYHIGSAVVEALADLHLVDPAEAGLSDLGRPEGFLARQVRGWRSRWAAVDTGRVAEMSAVAAELERTLPDSPQRVSVLHNDFKIDNCQFSYADPTRVTSVFDWDMATLGDPLCDLGTLLGYWPDDSDEPGTRALYLPGLERIGLPSRAEVVETYARRTGIAVDRIRWYQAFASWRTAVILEQLYQRWLRGDSTDDRMADRAEPVGRLAARARAMLS
jgi:aminoglycoside phosphotransferase (APT) family kinase protein